MRKMFVLLLLTGIILGMISVIGEISDEHVEGECGPVFSEGGGCGGDLSGQFSPMTCDGAGEGGSGGGIPG